MSNKKKKRIQELESRLESLTPLLNHPMVTKALDLAKEATQKQEQLDAILARGLNYGVLREIVENVGVDVKITLQMATEEVMVIERKDPVREEFASDFRRLS